ncbi:LysR family transcriptional regulator [Leucothrix sargassi]|nr:LysR family transcriptional regulator [Leucothrix sargassi]
MTPKQVRSLLAVVDLGSVNQAAERLHRAPSSISAQIKELSLALGVELFEPVGRRIVLSAAGKQLLPSFRQFNLLVNEITQEAQSIAHEAKGELKLFAPSSMCIYRLPVLIEALQKHAPQVEVLLTHEPFDYRKALQQGDIDAAIVVSLSESEQWKYHHLYEEDVIYVCHPKRYQETELPLSELSQLPLITTELGCSYRSCAEANFKSQGLVFQPRQSFANVEVVRRCLLANLGIGLLPRCVVEEDLKNGQLVQLPVESAPYQFRSSVIYPVNRKPSPRLAALLDIVEAL